MFALRLVVRKTVVMFHGIWYYDRDPRESVAGRASAFVQKMTILLSHGSIAPGEIMKQWFYDLHGEVVRQKMVVIPNGVRDLKVKRNVRVRGKYGLEGPVSCLFFGAMFYRPNYESALALFNLSRRVSEKFMESTGRRLVFLVAGSGSERLPRSDCYIPLGFVEDLDEMYSLADFVVLAHTQTGTGPHVKTLYSFLSNVPVLATPEAVMDIPGIQDGVHYRGFSMEEPNTLSAALLELSADAGASRQLASNALTYVRGSTWRRIASQYLDLYRRILVAR